MGAFPEQWPDGLNALAAIHFDVHQPSDRRADAWQRMAPKITAFARRIVNCGFPGLRRPLRDDLIEESPNEVALKHGLYDPGQPYEPWCRTVLENRFIDAARKKREQPWPGPTEDSAAYEDRIPNRQEPRLAVFFGTPFPETDLYLMEGWPAQVRRVFLLKTRLWTKLPARQAAEWLGDLPLRELGDASDGQLAAACGLSLAAFRNKWSRCHHYFYQLQALLDLVDFPEPGPQFFDQLCDEARRRYRCLEGQIPIEFPQEELKLLARRKPQEDVPRNMLVLSVSGLYPRVPREPWNAWVDRDGFVRPYPPASARTRRRNGSSCNCRPRSEGPPAGWPHVGRSTAESSWN
jgi:DNA-directed RNA polymerase specialized sigma24 family protein